LGGPKTTADAPPTKEEQCQQLTASLETLEKELASRQKELIEIEEDVANMTISIKVKETELETEQRELDRKEKLYSLLPDAPANLNRIEKLLETNQQKMADMEQQWLEIKQPLEDEYQDWLQKHKNVLIYLFKF
jgi:chromosome segregation ATPase